jgi:MerR family transcriptional regulator/heat shock protein HspR
VAGERRDLFEHDQGVFMISVAAELAGMHPQTLRIYEARGLIKPQRSPKQTRLYSRRDVERLRRINRLTTEAGMNLAGVERVLALEELMEGMQVQLERLQLRAQELERQMRERIDQVHRSYRRDLVPWKPPGAIARRADVLPRGYRITVDRNSQKANES